MKGKNLMIGDWVCVNGLTQQVFYLAYNQNEKELTIGVLDPQGDVYQCFYGFDHVEPIPLTAEILENNGWEYGNWGSEDYDDEYYTFIDDFDIHIDGNQTFEIRTVDGCTIKLKYVHELQHALRLCGIDKTIEL